jgi:hypothetical protein
LNHAHAGNYLAAMRGVAIKDLVIGFNLTNIIGRYLRKSSYGKAVPEFEFVDLSWLQVIKKVSPIANASKTTMIFHALFIFSTPFDRG